MSGLWARHCRRQAPRKPGSLSSVHYRVRLEPAHCCAQKSRANRARRAGIVCSLALRRRVLGSIDRVRSCIRPYRKDPFLVLQRPVMTEKGREGHWQRHVIFDVLDNESPGFADVTGDGKPEIVCCSRGCLGYAEADWKNPASPWKFHAISPKSDAYHKFTHGLGCGDVNGDGRVDFLEKDGWWEQPPSLANDPLWTKHPFQFGGGQGGAQMYVYDVNGDGFADLIIGAPRASPHGSYEGSSYVVFGKASGFAATTDLSSLDGKNGFRLDSVAAFNRRANSGTAARL